MTRSSSLRFGVIVALALSLTTVPLFAKHVASISLDGVFGFVEPVVMPLNEEGVRTLSFSGKGVHIITYSAQCAHDGTPLDWVVIRIVVDGVPIPVPSELTAFCTGNSTTGVLDGWAVSSYTVRTPSLVAGAHSVQIHARTFGGGEGALGNSSLVVQK